MNKLTKQQAEWLIDKIKAFYLLRYPHSNDVHNYSLDIKDFLNQCTEKEFPAFSSRKDSFSISLIQEDSDDPLIKLSSDGCMTFEEFKQFTQACNKIVSWFDEL